MAVTVHPNVYFKDNSPAAFVFEIIWQNVYIGTISTMFTSNVSIKRLKGIIGHHQFLNKASLCMRHVAICQLLVKWSSLWTQIQASTGGEVKWQHVRLQIPHMVVLCRTLRRPLSPWKTACWGTCPPNTPPLMMQESGESIVNILRF